MPTLNYQSATAWRQLYFVGVTRTDPGNLNLGNDQLQALFSMVGTPSVIGTGAAVDPRFVINQKGVTVWLLLFARLYTGDRDGLRDVSEGKAAFYVPQETVRSSFGQHVHWPKEVLARHDLELPGMKFFVLPFLQFAAKPAPAPLPRSLKSPHGDFEIMGIREFDDRAPEQLLQDLSALRAFILSHRPDLTTPRQ